MPYLVSCSGFSFNPTLQKEFVYIFTLSSTSSQYCVYVHVCVYSNNYWIMQVIHMYIRILKLNQLATYLPVPCLLLNLLTQQQKVKKREQQDSLNYRKTASPLQRFQGTVLCQYNLYFQLQKEIADTDVAIQFLGTVCGNNTVLNDHPKENPDTTNIFALPPGHVSYRYLVSDIFNLYGEKFPVNSSSSECLTTSTL